MEEKPSPPAVRISALVLSYNDAAGLRRCLTALGASTGRPELEIIVMDNGSMDGSGELDGEFPGVTFLRLPRNFGATKALNIAMRTAVGEYFLYLSTDMEVASDAVAKLAARLDSDPDAAAVAPLVVDAAGKPSGDYWRLPDGATLKAVWRDPGAMPRSSVEGASTVEYAGRSALMARKFFVKGLNFFDERFGEFGADLDLAFQIRRSGRKIALVEDARFVRYPAPALPASARTILEADRANGVSVFLTKHHGMPAGLGFQVGAALGALVRFQFGLLTAVAGGSKIDGSQSTL